MSIYKGKNLLKLGESKRLKFDSAMKQINFLDYRVYERSEGVYYPSVTSILQYVPKGRFFENWLKEAGPSADVIKQKAAKEGTQTHNLIERLIKGEEISWMDDFGNAICNEEVWQMVLKFVDFWNTYKPTPVAIEQFLYSDEDQYAGTVDFVCKLNGETWIIDFKTSNNLHRSYEMQLASYVKAWQEMGKGAVDRAGILWLKSAKRGPSKQKGKIQGKGWELSEVEDIPANFDLFKTVYKLYKLDHPKIEPIYKNYPVTVKLETTENDTK